LTLNNFKTNIGIFNMRTKLFYLILEFHIAFFVTHIPQKKKKKKNKNKLKSRIQPKSNRCDVAQGDQMFYEFCYFCHFFCNKIFFFCNNFLHFCATTETYCFAFCDCSCNQILRRGLNHFCVYLGAKSHFSLRRL